MRDDAKPASRDRKPRNGSPKAGPKAAPRKRTRDDFITYQVSWGAHGGADTRRLLAMVCRRGEVSSDVVGAIRVAPKSSTVEISSSVVQEFERSVTRPDERSPRTKFRRWNPDAGAKRPRRRAEHAS